MAAAARRVRQRRDASGYDAGAPPLLVQVLAGNSVTAAAVLPCLNTVDATTLRRLHPAVAAVVAGVPWSDMGTEVHDMVLWRAALPAAVGASARHLWLRGKSVRAALAGLTHLDLSHSLDVSEATLQCLPLSLRALNVRGCPHLAEDDVKIRFERLTALESLECSDIEDECHLPPSLRELKYYPIAYPNPLDFRHLSALRLLTISPWYDGGYATVVNLPPSLEEVCALVTPNSSLAHLTRLRVLRTSTLDNHTLASLPPRVVELAAAHSEALTPSASFVHLQGLRVLNVSHCGIGDATLATLPPSLTSLDMSACRGLTAAAVLPYLPALNDIDVSNTAIGGALVVSLPPGLVQLRIINCPSLTRSTSLDHLTALRELQTTGTDLAPAVLASCRARGCVAQKAGVLSGLECRVYCFALLADGRLASGNLIGAVRLWGTVHGGEATRLYLVDQGRACALAALPNDRLAVGIRRGDEGAIDVVRVRAALPVKERTIDCGSGVCALALLQNGHLAAGCDDGHVRVLDKGTKSVTATLKGHAGRITALAALPDGSLASASADGTVRIWSMVDGGYACAATLTGHTDQVRMLAVLADSRLVSGSWDGTVRLWDVGARACVHVLTAVGNIGAMAALPDGRLVTGSWRTGTIRLWDVMHPAGKSDSCPAATVPSIVLARRTGGVRALLPLPGGRLASGHDAGYPHYVWQVPAMTAAPKDDSAACGGGVWSGAVRVLRGVGACFNRLL